MTRRRRRPLLMDQTVIVGRRSTPHVVYAFRFPSRPWALKIGYSSRGLERIREQTTGYPEAPEVVLVFHHRDAKRIERALHDSLSPVQMHGTVGTEWFRAGLEDLVAASPDLRAAMGRQFWRSKARWIVAALGLGVWSALLPLWFALFHPGGRHELARVASEWTSAPFSAFGGALDSVGTLVGGGVGLDALIPPILVALAWVWWSVLRR
jgi:T5orf172 domain